MSESMVGEVAQELHALSLQTEDGCAPVAWASLTQRQQQILETLGDAGFEANEVNVNWGKFTIRTINNVNGRFVIVMKELSHIEELEG